MNVPRRQGAARTFLDVSSLNSDPGGTPAGVSFLDRSDSELAEIGNYA
jgi:hypothetical protein